MTDQELDERKLKDLTERIFGVAKEMFSGSYCKQVSDRAIYLGGAELYVFDFNSVCIEVSHHSSYERAMNLGERVEKDFSKEEINVTLRKKY